MDHISLTIDTLSPVVLTSSKGETVLTESGDFIPANVLRGVIAGMYINNNNLGREADKDEGFRKSFFGGFSFLDAMPACGLGRAMEAPRSLMKAKEASGISDVRDILAGGDVPVGYKRLSGLVVIPHGTNKVCTISVRKNISLHMSRDHENERRVGKSVDGGIFNYEGICAGQQFQGGICGNAEELTVLLDKIGVKPGDTIDCYIGRSRFTEYGHCRMKFGTIKPMPEMQVKANGNTVCLRLNSPAIPYGGTTMDCRDVIAKMIADELGEGYHIGRVFAAVQPVDNFVGVWGVRNQRVSAIAAGSVFEVISDSGWDGSALDKVYSVIDSGIGLRKYEGYGQVRPWNPGKLEMSQEKATEEEAPLNIRPDGMAAELAGKIARKLILGKLRQLAYEDVEGLNRVNFVGFTHFYTRISSVLGTRENTTDRKKVFAGNLKAELGEATSTPFRKALDDVKVGGISLKKRLIDETSTAQPYSGRVLGGNGVTESLMNDIGMNLTENDLSDGEFFYVYWHWFFRYARKRAADEGKKVAD